MIPTVDRKGDARGKRRSFIVFLNEPRYLMRPGALAAASMWPGVHHFEEIGAFIAPHTFFIANNDNLPGASQ